MLLPSSPPQRDFSETTKNTHIQSIFGPSGAHRQHCESISCKSNVSARREHRERMLKIYFYLSWLPLNLAAYARCRCMWPTEFTDFNATAVVIVTATALFIDTVRWLCAIMPRAASALAFNVDMHTNAHTLTVNTYLHTHTYIYIYICLCARVSLWCGSVCLCSFSSLLAVGYCGGQNKPNASNS